MSDAEIAASYPGILDIEADQTEGRVSQNQGNLNSPIITKIVNFL